MESVWIYVASLWRLEGMGRVAYQMYTKSSGEREEERERRLLLATLLGRPLLCILCGCLAIFLCSYFLRNERIFSGR